MKITPRAATRMLITNAAAMPMKAVSHWMAFVCFVLKKQIDVMEKSGAIRTRHNTRDSQRVTDSNQT